MLPVVAMSKVGRLAIYCIRLSSGGGLSTHGIAKASMSTILKMR